MAAGHLARFLEQRGEYDQADQLRRETAQARTASSQEPAESPADKDNDVLDASYATLSAQANLLAENEDLDGLRALAVSNDHAAYLLYEMLVMRDQLD